MVFFSLLPYTTIFDAIGDAAFAQVRKSAFYEKAHSVQTPSPRARLTEKRILRSADARPRRRPPPRTPAPADACPGDALRTFETPPVM